jgi:hypothetical protein
MVTLTAVLRRSSVPLGGLLIFAVSAALALTRHTPGFNLWSDRVAGLTSASIFTGVVASGVAAIESNRWVSANRLRIRTAYRSRLRMRVHHFLAVSILLIGGYLLAVVAVAAEAAITKAYGFPPLIWLISLACAVLFASSIGYAIGGALPRKWFVGPAVSIAFYAGYAVLIVSDLPYGLVSLYPASGNYITVFVRTVTSTLVAEAVFFTAAAAVPLFALSFQKRRAVRSVVLLGVGCAVAIAAGGVVVAENGQVVSGDNPRDFTCTTGSPVLCLNRGYASASVALQREFQALNRRAAGTPLVADRLEQNVQGYGDRPSHGSRSVYLEQWAARDDLTFSVYRYVQKYGGSARCRSGDAAYIETDVDSWLSGYYDSTAGADADEITRSLSKLSGADGNEWFRANYPAYATCTLTSADLP